MVLEFANRILTKWATIPPHGLKNLAQAFEELQQFEQVAIALEEE